MDAQRLARQLDFIMEVDKLKGVLRQTNLIGVARRENSAEHSWHLALMALLLVEYANQPVDLLQVITMLLIHDLVEIDAGDTYIYDEQAIQDKARREQQAADRIFGLLPNDQADVIRQLWEEFEARLTPEARFAAALDRLMPLLHNYHTQGASWKEHGIAGERVRARNEHIREGSADLWDVAHTLITRAMEQGYLSSEGSDR